MTKFCLFSAHCTRSYDSFVMPSMMSFIAAYTRSLVPDVKRSISAPHRHLLAAPYVRSPPLAPIVTNRCATAPRRARQATLPLRFKSMIVLDSPQHVDERSARVTRKLRADVRSCRPNPSAIDAVSPTASECILHLIPLDGLGRFGYVVDLMPS